MEEEVGADELDDELVEALIVSRLLLVIEAIGNGCVLIFSFDMLVSISIDGCWVRIVG